MRQPRIRRDSADTWHHCYNRCVGTALDRPLDDAEKEKFVRILQRVSILYTVRVVSYQVMSNHFHILLQAPVELSDPEEICLRYNAFHNGERTIEPNSRLCRQWQERCRDVSWFMRHLQHLFTTWFNRTRPVRRRGSLWADRFKNTILQSGRAVWSCWTYIENNPARAGMVRSATDYRFCSQGAWHQTGRHPFECNLTTIMLPMLKDLFGIQTLAEARGLMDQALTNKTEQEPASISFSLTVRRRVRHWARGLVIGSELFVREVMSRYRRDLDRHRMACSGRNEDALFAWRRVRLVESD